MGSATGNGFCWASSTMDVGESGAHGKCNKGKQSQPSHHSNRTAATGSFSSCSSIIITTTIIIIMMIVKGWKPRSAASQYVMYCNIFSKEISHARYGVSLRCMGSPTGDGVRWASSRLEFGESGAHGKSNRQSQACHHGNRMAAVGWTICCKICAFPSLMCREHAVYRVHSHHSDCRAKTRSIITTLACRPSRSAFGAGISEIGFEDLTRILN